jgi:hypothetical protein
VTPRRRSRRKLGNVACPVRNPPLTAEEDRERRRRNRGRPVAGSRPVGRPRGGGGA